MIQQNPIAISGLQEIVDRQDRHEFLLNKIIALLGGKSSSEDETYIDLNTACKLLKKSKSSVRRLLYSRRVEYLKLNNSRQSRVLIVRDSLERLLRQSRVPTKR